MLMLSGFNLSPTCLYVQATVRTRNRSSTSYTPEFGIAVATSIVGHYNYCSIASFTPARLKKSTVTYIVHALNKVDVEKNSDMEYEVDWLLGEIGQEEV